MVRISQYSGITTHLCCANALFLFLKTLYIRLDDVGLWSFVVFFSFSATRQSHRCLGWCAKSLHAFRLYRFNIFQFNVLIVNAHRFIVLSFQREMDLFSVRISCVNLCTAQREQQKEPCTHELHRVEMYVVLTTVVKWNEYDRRSMSWCSSQKLCLLARKIHAIELENAFTPDWISISRNLHNFEILLILIAVERSVRFGVKCFSFFFNHNLSSDALNDTCYRIIIAHLYRVPDHGMEGSSFISIRQIALGLLSDYLLWNGKKRKIVFQLKKCDFSSILLRIEIYSYKFHRNILDHLKMLILGGQLKFVCLLNKHFYFQFISSGRVG